MLPVLSQSALGALTGGSDVAACFTQQQPVSFVWLKESVNKTTGQTEAWNPDRVPGAGSPDVVLDNRAMWPEPSQMHEPHYDEDAHRLFESLSSLSSRPLTSLDGAVIMPTVPGYGVGSVVSGLIYPVMDALATGAPPPPLVPPL